MIRIAVARGHMDVAEGGRRLSAIYRATTRTVLRVALQDVAHKMAIDANSVPDPLEDRRCYT